MYIENGLLEYVSHIGASGSRDNHAAPRSVLTDIADDHFYKTDGLVKRRKPKYPADRGFDGEKD